MCACACVCVNNLICTALPAISLAESDDDDDSFQMTLFFKAKRYQWPAVYQAISEGRAMCVCNIFTLKDKAQI